MALKALNSVAGFSVGEVPSIIIDANGNVTANNLTVTNKTDLGAVGNVKITGGSTGQVISTDGLGNLSFISVSTNSISNGTSNVSIPSVNGNVTISVGGYSNVVTVATTSIVVNGDVVANGNLSANSYIVTPSTIDLIVAPSTSITRFYSNVNPYSTDTYDLGNSLARWGNIFANNANFGNAVSVGGNVTAGGVKTDNLYYANGSPWDMQQPAGSSTYIQYNNNDSFGASANFTYNDATQLLTVTGNAQFNNANLGNLAIANYVNVSSNVTSNNVTVNLELSGNTANFTGNIKASNANLGNLVTANYVNVASTVTSNNVTVNLELSGNTANFIGNVVTSSLTVNVELQANTANFDGNVVMDKFLTVSNVANVGNLNVVSNVTSNLVPNANITFDLGNSTNQWNNVYAQNFIGNISGNITAPGANTQVLFNDANVANAVANLSYDKTYNLGGGRLNVGWGNNGQVITDDLYTAYANVNGNLDVTANVTAGNVTTSGIISTTGTGGDITMTGGNISGANVISANTGSFTGNVSAANFVGALANGTSNVKVYNGANVEISVGGSDNVVSITTAGIYVDGEINTTGGNILSNGNVTANSFLNSANANITGEAKLGSVLTSNITAPTGSITISAAGVNQNIVLAPSGTGNIDVGLHNIVELGAPVNPNDAATKEYVDSVAQGLTIHAPVRVEANAALNATYTQGGTTQTTTDITGGKTITFSSNHGLSVDDGIVWTNSFNGIVGGEAYWVYSTPALNQITISDGYNGAEITTLTNGTGLSQASRANPGVGATLVNAGANAALVLDNVSVANGDRVLVYSQVNAYENGIYSVTDKGNLTAAWVLTRSTDMNKYIPQSTTGMGYGDYFFIQEGATAAGESYVLTSPQGEIIIGTDNLTFTQFSSAGTYTAGNGIAINGTIISANVDGVTTDIVGGNIVVKTSANLTTPNIGDASFSSLSWNTSSNGNVTANNLSIGNIANITGNLRVDGLIQSNGNVSSNAYVNANNLFVTNDANVQGNILGANITANSTVFAANANVSGTAIANALTVNTVITGNTANFSGNVVVPNLTVNLEFAGNTANFSGNVLVPNLTVNLELAGNTANFSGNVISNNLTVNNAITANTANLNGNLTISNATAGWGIKTDNLYYSNGQPWDLQQAAGSNTQIQFNNGSNDFGASANLTFDTATNTLDVNGTVDVSTNIILGNTGLNWATVTTSSTTANQTIASILVTGVTGVEFLVKGIDSAGSGKYSVATVQAVTDGTNADYTVFGTIYLGGPTGTLAVNISGGYIRLQTTPSSSNSTVWTTQARTI